MTRVAAQDENLISGTAIRDTKPSDGFGRLITTTIRMQTIPQIRPFQILGVDAMEALEGISRAGLKARKEPMVRLEINGAH